MAVVVTGSAKERFVQGPLQLQYFANQVCRSKVFSFIIRRLSIGGQTVQTSPASGHTNCQEAAVNSS